MGNESQWAGSRLRSSVASSRPVANAWQTEWMFRGDNTIDVPSLPADVSETDVVALISSLAMKSEPEQDGVASASFSEAHLFASDSYQVADSYVKRGRSDACIDTPCGVAIIVTDESGRVCDPAVGQETGTTSSGGNSSGSAWQSTGWGTPDRNAGGSPFGSSWTDKCESYSGSEQWATTRSAVINYWPADYDHESAVARTGTAQTHVDVEIECNKDLNQQAGKDGSGSVRHRSSHTRYLETSSEFSRAPQKGNRDELCQTCYERQMELRTIDNEINAASQSKFKPLSSESRSRWFPRSQTVERCGGIAADGI